MEKKYAVLVVDMLNDFVTGALKCDRGLAIVPKTKQLLAGCREKNVPVISDFAEDFSSADVYRDSWDDRWYVNVATVLWGMLGF